MALFSFAFFFLGTVFPDVFSLQNQVVGLTGAATSQASFFSILGNNLLVFSGILVVSAIIGSAGAFILTWNASVLGFFLAHIFQDSPGKVLAYLPHATLEMTGFIVGGVSGTLISVAVYREHFERDTWINLAKLAISGVFLIVLAAILETA